MQIVTAKASLLGDRDQNQDRVGVLRRGDTLLAVVMDGMGGHSQGDLAAEVGLESMLNRFAKAKLPLIKEQAFLTELILEAHEAVIKAGLGLPIAMMPRSTTAVCLIQRDRMHWVHVGDSRIYLIRQGKMLTRTRDHTHVEMLVQQGLISEAQVNQHPMRNFVESCLGGEIEMSTLTESGPIDVNVNDSILLCSDGLWSAFKDRELAESLSSTKHTPQNILETLCSAAVEICHPISDNTSGILLQIKEL